MAHLFVLHPDLYIRDCLSLQKDLTCLQLHGRLILLLSWEPCQHSSGLPMTNQLACRATVMLANIFIFIIDMPLLQPHVNYWLESRCMRMSLCLTAELRLLRPIRVADFLSEVTLTQRLVLLPPSLQCPGKQACCCKNCQAADQDHGWGQRLAVPCAG